MSYIPGTRTRVEEAVEKNAEGLLGTWRHDPDLITKHFPVDEYIRQTFCDVKAAYVGILHTGRRWTKIRIEPSQISQLYTPLNNLFNRIIEGFGLANDERETQRLCINTSVARIHPILDLPLQPQLLLAGSGRHFVRSIAMRPLRCYSQAICPIEICLEDDNHEAVRDRLAFHIQQVIRIQQTRRFVFGLVMSQATLTVYMFDRSGAVYSSPLDYHASPEQFCALVAGLMSMDPVKLGHDPSVTVAISGMIRVMESSGRQRRSAVDYRVVRTLHYSPALVGRGTVCFEVHPKSNKDDVYVIKDTWSSLSDQGRESESSLLAHARLQGVTIGIPFVRHSETVHVKDSAGINSIDGTFNNRRATEQSSNDRIHTRIVMSPCGSPILDFSTREELLLTYRDAILAHRRLLDVAGILHRDIKPDNILMVTDDDGTTSGMLIDFDHSIRVVDTSPYSEIRGVGTYMFMSHNSLGNHPQTYLDDLESFYYVLVFITLMFIKPGIRVTEKPRAIELWSEPIAPTLKREIFVMVTSPFQVQPWFGPVFQTLIHKIHELLSDVHLRTTLKRFGRLPASEPDFPKEEVYDTILSHISEAIEALKATPMDPQLDFISVNPPDTANTNRDEDTRANKMRQLRASRKNVPKLAVTTLAGNRSLRKTAHFAVSG